MRKQLKLLICAVIVWKRAETIKSTSSSGAIKQFQEAMSYKKKRERERERLRIHNCLDYGREI
jgi:hypothetical protein